MDLIDYLSPINPLSRLSHPIHLRCIGSYLSLFLYPLPLLSLYSSFTYPLISSTSTRDHWSRVGWDFALFSLYTHFTYIPSLYHPYIVRVFTSSHPISKIGWVFILHSLFILPSLSVFFYYYISYLILFLYCTYYTTISSLLPVGCVTPYGVCLHLIYSIIYFYCLPTFTFFSLSYLYYITLFSISIFSFTRRVFHTLRGWVTSFFLSLYPLIVYLILSILYQIYPSFLYGTLSSSITRRVFHTLRGFYTSSLLISISSISYSLFSLCTIPYLSVLPLLHTFLLFILYCLHILHTSSTTRRVTPYGLSTLSIVDVYILSHLFIYTSFIHIFTLFTYLYILLLTHILIFIIFLLIIYIIIL